LKTGNLQLYKKDYENREEGYQVNLHVDSKIFKCKYVVEDYQISSKLNHDND